MIQRPRVSVITCVYNAERFVRSAIESILSQSFEDFEYLLVDDSSTDSSLEILRSYLYDPRVRVLEMDHRCGPYAAANVALVQVRGEYVARLDADDVALPHRLALQTEFLGERPEVGLVGTAYQWFDERDGKRRQFEPFIEECLELRWALLFWNPIGHSTAMYRRSLVERLGHYGDGWHSQDYDLWLRMSRVAQLAQLRTVTVYSRMAETGLTLAQSAAQRSAAGRVSRRALSGLLKRPVDDPEITAYVSWLYGSEEKVPKNLGRARAFMMSLIEPFCAQFGYGSEERARVLEQVYRQMFWLARAIERSSPFGAFSIYARLIADCRQPRSYLRFLPALGKLILGRRGIKLAEGARFWVRATLNGTSPARKSSV
jgi:glycosyltransferase involved in cell wall biosynthesis